MFVHRMVTPSSMSPVPIYTRGWRETEWCKIPCPREQRDGQGLNPWPPYSEFEVLTAPPLVSTGWNISNSKAMFIRNWKFLFCLEMHAMAKMTKNCQRAGGVQKCTQWRIWWKFKWGYKRSAPYKVEKVTKMANLTNRMPKVAPWRVAILAKMVILAKIHLRCSKTCNELLKGAPSLVTNLTKNLPSALAHLP